MKICITSRLVTITLLALALHATPAVAQQSSSMEPTATAAELTASTEPASVPPTLSVQPAGSIGT